MHIVKLKGKKSDESKTITFSSKDELNKYLEGFESTDSNGNKCIHDEKLYVIVNVSRKE